jgi:hypothetical protein
MERPMAAHRSGGAGGTNVHHRRGDVERGVQDEQGDADRVEVGLGDEQQDGPDDGEPEPDEVQPAQILRETPGGG